MKPTEEQKAIHAKLNASRFNWLVVAQYLCKVNNVADVCDIVPFGTRIPAWLLARKSVLGVQITAKDITFNVKTEDHEGQAIEMKLQGGTSECIYLNDPQPKDRFMHPVSGQPMDSNLDEVMIYSITCRHYRSNVPIPVAARLNFYHEAMAELQQTREQDAMFSAAGAVRGAFTVLKPTPVEGKDIDDVPLPELSFAYQNSFFTQTMALVTESNLMNGIIPIIPEVCAAAGLPIWKGPPELSDEILCNLLKSMKINPETEEGSAKRAEINKQYQEEFMEDHKNAKRNTFFYAIPINHVLAWGYHSEDYMVQRGHRAEQFRFIHPQTSEPVLLYYLVGNAYFDSILESFKQDWLGKIDKRPLRQTGFQFLPILQPHYDGVPAEATHVTGSLSLRSYVSYFSTPSLAPATIAGLAPTLCPGFPSSSEWSVDQLAKQIAIEKFAADQEKGAKVKRK